MKIKLRLLLVCIGLTLLVNAQGKTELHLGAVMPLGEFANYDYDYFMEGSGCATTGIVGGIKFFRPIKSTKGLFYTFGLDINVNGLNRDLKDRYKSTFDSNIKGTDAKSDIKYFKYINAPLLAGLNYKYPLNKDAEIYADAAMGINFANMSEMVVTVTSPSLYSQPENEAKMITSVSSSNGFATQLGLGILIQKKVSISVHYNQLGTYKMSGEISNSTDSRSTTFSTDVPMTINTLNFELGIRL